MEILIITYCNYNLWISLDRNSSMLHAEAVIGKTDSIRHVFGIQKKTAVFRLNTDRRHLTTGIRSEKCVVRRFRRCAHLY